MGDIDANLSRGEGVQFYHDSSLGGTIPTALVVAVVKDLGRFIT